MRFKFISLALLTFAVFASAGACSSSDEQPVTTGPDAAPANDENRIPCGPRRVLQTVCQQCHTTPLKAGAPFPITTRSDVFASYQGDVIRVLIVEQLNARRMPLEPVTMDDDQRKLLLDWVNAGAYAVAPQVCKEPTPPDDGGLDASAATDAADADSGDSGADGDADSGNLDGALDADVDSG